jgi:arylsulfatase A-like enzyme
VSNWVLRRPAPELGDVGVAQGFASFDDKMDAAERNRDSRERRAEATTDAALAWLDGPGRADRFFLWVHYQDPHGPYDPPEELARPFLADLPADEAPLPVSTSNRGKDGIPAYQRIGDERRPGRYRARYDGEIAAFDRGFGRLLAGLGERGLLEDALVIFTADHGESLGEHERWFCHAENLHVEETRVPLVVRFPASTPGGARRGERRAELASHLDLFPTVLAAFGLAPPPRIGASLLAVSLPADRVVPQTLYPLESPRRWEALTSQRHRLVFNRRYGMRLYDLATDPGELHDLAAEDPATLARIQAQGRALLRANPAGPAPAVQPSDEESARALRAMGYAGEEDEERDPGGAEKGRR